MKYDSDLVRESAYYMHFFKAIATTQLLLNYEMKEVKSDCQFCR